MAHEYAAKALALSEAAEAMLKVRKAAGPNPNDGMTLTVAGFSFFSTKQIAESEVQATLDQARRSKADQVRPMAVALNRHNFGAIRYEVPVSGPPKLILNPASGQQPDAILSVLSTATQHFEPFDYASNLETLVGAGYADALSGLHTETARTREILDRALRETFEHQQEIDQRHREQKEALEVELASHKQRLDAEHATRMEELDRRQAEMDALDARAARRRDFKKLSEQLKAYSESMSLTEGTVEKRKPIARALIGAAALSLLGLIALFYFGSSLADSLGWSLHVARGTATLGVLAPLWYYVRWNNHWFSQHAEEEFHAKRLALDVGRANWLVELAMEWREQIQEDIPEEMVAHLARSLFDERRPSNPVATPHEELLATILGTAAKIEVQMPGGSKLLADRKGAKSKKGGD